MTTEAEQDARDARKITMVIFTVIALILMVAYDWPYIFGKVEVKQSVTTNAPVNICQGLPSACDMSLVFMNILHGSAVKVTDKHGSVFIDYCKDPEDCHTYRLNDNGAIRKVN